MNDDDDDVDGVDNDGGGLWRHRRRAAAAALHWRLVVVSPTPPSAARSVIHRFRRGAIVNTFAAGRRPLSPTFISRCPVTSARRARRYRNDIVTLARERVCFLLCERSRFDDDWAREGGLVSAIFVIISPIFFSHRQERVNAL